MIKSTIIAYLQKQIKDILKKDFDLEVENFIVEKNREISNGEFYSNIAMTIAKKLKRNPIELAEELSAKLQPLTNQVFSQIKVAKPGYLNFYLTYKFIDKHLNYVLNQHIDYGQFLDKKIAYNIEFVSANPTGFLHIGHARNAALGMTLANVWKKYGINVVKEYYINDAGNQINILGISVFLRYLQLCNIDAKMDGDYYMGSEIIDIAQQIRNEFGEKFVDCKYDDKKIDDNEIFEFFKEYSLNKMLTFIKQDLAELKIEFDIFSSEKSLYKENAIENVLENLKNHTYEKDGALWLKTTTFNDDKDRVLIKNNGDYTYFLPDIAYHFQKITRNPSVKKIFNIWGADHKSYVDRMTIALECLDFPKDIMHVIIMQMVRLTKDNKEFKMSKRSGNSLTLKDLIEAIGQDGARWALVSQTAATQIEIDVDKFKSQTYENNLFYVLYAYARICQILNKIETDEKKINSSLLINEKEKELINLIIYYPCTIETIANSYEVNKITNYLYNLAQVIHSYYNDVKIVDDSNVALMNQRKNLLKALKYVLYSGLSLLNITPKEKI